MTKFNYNFFLSTFAVLASISIPYTQYTQLSFANESMHSNTATTNTPKNKITERKTQLNLFKKKEKEELKINDEAPNIALPDQTGKLVNLASFKSKNIVVLYFYPKDDTSVCTAEACGFRDSFQAFSDLGAVVIGVSSDHSTSHKKFADKYHLPFILLADSNNMARKAFRVPASIGILPGRVTYVIDKEGKIRYIFNSMTDGPKHVSEAMKIVKELAAK